MYKKIAIKKQLQGMHLQFPILYKEKKLSIYSIKLKICYFDAIAWYIYFPSDFPSTNRGGKIEFLQFEFFKAK